MDEKIFSEWKEDNAELYAKFKVDLEEQLKKPYHQTILDMSKGKVSVSSCTSFLRIPIS